MPLLSSFGAVSPRMPQHAWREAMLGKLPNKWARSMSRRLDALDCQHRDWYHGNVFLREHVARYAETVLPLTASLSDIRECAQRRAAEAQSIAERLTSMDAILPALGAL